MRERGRFILHQQPPFICFLLIIIITTTTTTKRTAKATTSWPLHHWDSTARKDDPHLEGKISLTLALALHLFLSSTNLYYKFLKQSRTLLQISPLLSSFIFIILSNNKISASISNNLFSFTSEEFYSSLCCMWLSRYLMSNSRCVLISIVWLNCWPVDELENHKTRHEEHQQAVSPLLILLSSSACSCCRGCGCFTAEVASWCWC